MNAREREVRPQVHAGFRRSVQGDAAAGGVHDEGAGIGALDAESLRNQARMGAGVNPPLTC